MMKEQQMQQINIELGEKEAEGIYSNFVLITHSPAEIVLDFSRMVPGVPKARVYSRILMTPQHAKSLFNTLKDTIEKFENEFGEIKAIGMPQNKSFGFKPSAAHTGTVSKK